VRASCGISRFPLAGTPPDIRSVVTAFLLAQVYSLVIQGGVADIWDEVPAGVQC